MTTSIPTIIHPASAVDQNPDTCPGLTTETALTPEEQNALRDCEAQLGRYKQAFLDAGRALRTIREGKLYRETHKTFEAYCGEKWGFTSDRAGQLMRGSETVETLIAAGVTDLPTNESQVRPLSKLDDEQQVELWKQSVAENGSASNVSHEKVKAVVAKAQGTAPPRSLHDLTAEWAPEARRALSGTPADHRATVAAFVNGLGQEVTAELVAETVDGHNAAVVEDGLTTQPALVGTAAEFVEAQGEYEDECVTDDEPSGTAESPIVDLDVLPDPDPAHTPTQSRSIQFLGAGAQKPLLVSLSRDIAPAALTDGLPVEVKEVIVELAELHRLGGPVQRIGNELVLDLDEIRGAAREAGVKKVLQRTNENVDWARYTTNPLTGCWHQCRSVFCYAAGIARRRFAQGFIPTLYPARLDAFKNTKARDISGLTHDEAWRERSVFIVSMGDLFGTWVPDYYVQAVLDEVGQHPEYFVFFLSKNPLGLQRFTFPANCAVGVTLTGDDKGHGGSMDEAAQRRMYAKYAEALGAVGGCSFKWISLEPFRAEVHDLTPFFEAGVRMVAVGGQTRTTLVGRGGEILYSPAFQPELAWVDAVRRQVRDAGVFLFEKENLLVRPKEIPFPAGLPAAAPGRRKPATRPGASSRPPLKTQGGAAKTVPDEADAVN